MLKSSDYCHTISTVYFTRFVSENTSNLTNRTIQCCSVKGRDYNVREAIKINIT